MKPTKSVVSFEQQAEDAEKESLYLTDKTPEGYIKLSDIYAATNRLDNAVEVLENGVKAIPDSLKIHISLSNAYIRQGKIANSIKHLKFVFRSDPS